MGMPKYFRCGSFLELRLQPNGLRCIRFKDNDASILAKEDESVGVSIAMTAPDDVLAGKEIHVFPRPPIGYQSGPGGGVTAGANDYLEFLGCDQGRLCLCEFLP